MNHPETLSMTRRCFFAATGVALAVPAVTGTDKSSANDAELPKAALLSDGDAKTYLLEFSTGQEVMRGIQAFARKHKLVAGHLTGIGAVEDMVLGYFDTEKRTYLRTHEKGQYEVLSMVGNLALRNDKPFFHVHVALGLNDSSACGGHRFEAIVRPTVELVLNTYPKPARRNIDPETGLPLPKP